MGSSTTDISVAAASPPLRDVAAAELRRMILDGRLTPGERLVEDRLAVLLGVSRQRLAPATRTEPG